MANQIDSIELQTTQRSTYLGWTKRGEFFVKSAYRILFQQTSASAESSLVGVVKNFWDGVWSSKFNRRSGTFGGHAAIFFPPKLSYLTRRSHLLFHAGGARRSRRPVIMCCGDVSSLNVFGLLVLYHFRQVWSLICRLWNSLFSTFRGFD